MTDRIRPTVSFTIICDDVRQEMGGKISLMGLFENIYATKFPAIHPRLAVVTEWSEGKGEFEVRMRLIAPDRNTVLRETLSRMKLNGVNFRHRDVSVHLNIEFKEPGTYWIENLVDNELIYSMPIKVVQVREQSTH
ncbi:MAG: hypothetical protein P8Z71_01680 [Candidatus Sulfobium sp.]|jgi:Family of unknown function (DUF6941)